MNPIPTFNQLQKLFLESGYEIRHLPRPKMESLALDSPWESKRHNKSNIMGLIMPDEYTIALADDLTPTEQATTLIHELIHLWNESLDEDTVETLTRQLEHKLTPKQFGFFQFAAS